MRRWTVFLWAVASGVLLHAAAPVPPKFLLPGVAQPLRYRLDLTIVPNRETFQGVAIIEIDLKQRLDYLWLNGKDIAVRRASLHAGDRTISLRTTAQDEFLGFALAEPTGPGPVRLEISYDAKLSDKGATGAYRRESHGDWYVFTTFTAIEARRAFPCFDEPHYKTPWQLTINIPQNNTALANTRELSETAGPAGMKKVVFAPTLPLPSELIAFAVGPFDVVDAGRAGQRQVQARIITPRGRSAEAAYARTATPDILAKLEDYTGMPYPWDKLDQIALLEGAYGAVENPGLITYRQRILIANPADDTAVRRRGLRATMAHELAHQWFGNAVTQSTWEDVWLSEGFATWLGGKITDLEQPAARRGVSAAAARDRIMTLDARTDSRKVRLPLSSREEMKHVYDGVVYQKGAAILAELEGWLGEETFQRGVRGYLSAHNFSDASTTDLAMELSHASGRDVAPVMQSLLDQAGVPVVHAELHCDGQTPRVTLRQEPAKWKLPVCVRAADSSVQCVMLETGNTEIPLTGVKHCPVWILANAGATGYFRSELSTGQFASLVHNGFEHMTAAERLSAILDMAALVYNGRVPASEALKLLPSLAQDPEPQVVVAAMNLANALSAIVPPAQRERYNEYVRATFGSRRDKPEDPEALRHSQEKSVADFVEKLPAKQ